MWEGWLDGDEEWEDLEAWVARGHTLIITGRSDRLRGHIERLAGDAAIPTAAHAAVRGVTQISVGEGTFGEVPEDALVLLARPDGTPVLIGWRHGKGLIYRSADPEWLTNARIAREQNLELAMQLLSPAPGKEVAFNEYAHGISAAERWWQMLRGPLQAFALQLMAALLVMYWAYSARFGNPSPVPAGPARASAEYVYSMSQLYRRAGARSVVLKALHRSLTRGLSRFLGSTHGLSHAEVAQRTAERTGLKADQIRTVLDKTAPGAPETMTDRELIALTREAEAIQRRVQHAGYRDQRNPGTDSK